jgi:Amt family ammonium transporter
MDYCIVALAAATLLVRVGLALSNCGLVRAKNAGGTLLRHVADVCVATLAFWAIGMAVLAGPYGKIAPINWRLMFGLFAEPGFDYWFFEALVRILFCTGIVVGALSERSRFFPSLAPALLLASFGIPLVIRWGFGQGWLAKLGFHDFAGASFIHVMGGACAAAGAILIGPRNGKYNRDGSTNVIPGHSLPIFGAGVLLMIVAWFPYLQSFVGYSGNPGVVALNALFAGAAGGMASLLVANVRFGKPDIYMTFTGFIAGLVAITAGADVVGHSSAVLIGTTAGLLVPWIMQRIDMVWKIDDPTGAIAIHGVGGAWGLLAAGIFALRVPFKTKLLLIGTQVLGILVVAALAVFITAGLFLVLKRFGPLRASESDEFDGLDLAEHDIGSYPDFQQTMIKSYHLRET